MAWTITSVTGEAQIFVDGTLIYTCDKIAKGSFSFGPDGNGYAFAAASGNEWRIVTHESESDLYEQVTNPVWSSESECVYAVKSASETHVFSNQRKVHSFQGILDNRILVDPETRHFIYAGGQERDWAVFVDHAPIGEGFNTVALKLAKFCGTEGFVWVPVEREGEWYFICSDGREEGPFLALSGLATSSDERHLGYIASREPGRFVVVFNGKQVATHKSATDLRLSEDGQHYCYMFREGKQRFVMASGTLYGPYESVIGSSLKLSPDGNSCAFVATRDGRVFIVRDGEENKPVDDVKTKTLKFSNDSRRLRYIAKWDKREFVVLDGKAGRLFTWIPPNSVLFSEDNKGIAYPVLLFYKTFMMCNERRGTYQSWIYPETVSFTSDQTVSYVAYSEKQIRICRERITRDFR
ncbi:MAG TPA: hypothetical protein PKH07_05325 [bacterium]|nr:hypothetical protein [bacterium]